MVCIAEPLEVHDFPLPQEFNGVVYIRVVTEPEDVVIGDTGFLLCCEVVRTTFFEAVPYCPLFCQHVILKVIYHRIWSRIEDKRGVGSHDELDIGKQLCQDPKV